ncbi:RISC-loading complex subunit TARBP2-like [Venturia canescens]|uniref:RISC-loading complex subunit TARBP2-like n=1 Tax=Venturia canescens TaxID=32260 RepID=UPI001C9D3DE8|nr:RISC-loading complex subunit TARBP2-like [Venturia canescens]XP_043277007.1 RISC-loading complex subunit TARBP2-like [Venturia canescens]XP_043277008.1 RISC-loading complex subunit TARBP2-like [Venturia canescens]
MSKVKKLRGIQLISTQKRACDVTEMNVKTNVSILQEMMVKKGTQPNYDLIHDGGGTHINTFTYRVTCDGLMATGTGRCKKDAKHTAAKNMLETIAAARSLPQLPATPVDSPVRTPLPEKLPASPKISPNEPFLNAIGELKDLCAENELQDPEYNMISDVGPPHARIFTYQCVVSTFKEEGRAMTKKQAKHEASRKMLERLKDVVSDLTDKESVYASLKKDQKEVDLNASNLLAKSIYPELTKTHPKKPNLGVKVAEFHSKLKKSFNEESVPKRSEVVSNLESLVQYAQDNEEKCYSDYLDSIQSKLAEFLNLLNMELCYVLEGCDNEVNKILFLKVNSIPDIVEIEVGEDIVAMKINAIKKVLKSFQLLLE